MIFALGCGPGQARENRVSLEAQGCECLTTSDSDLGRDRLICHHPTGVVITMLEEPPLVINYQRSSQAADLTAFVKPTGSGGSATYPANQAEAQARWNAKHPASKAPSDLTATQHEMGGVLADEVDAR